MVLLHSRAVSYVLLHGRRVFETMEQCHACDAIQPLLHKTIDVVPGSYVVMPLQIAWLRWHSKATAGSS